MSNLKIDQEEFNRKAQHILDTVVRPQVERYEKAKAQQKNKMTAVEWYIKKIKEARQMCDDASMGMDIWHTLDVLIGKGEQAKEMEKEQMIKFAKHCLDKSIDLDILMAYNQVEIEYTNQTFKSE